MQQTINLKCFMKLSVLVAVAMCMITTPATARSCQVKGLTPTITPTLMPITTAPTTDAPYTEAPDIQAPETQVPETQAPETQAPDTDAPATVAPQTDPPTDPPTDPASPEAGEAPMSPGCGKSAPFQSGLQSVMVNGKNREYLVKLPDNYDSNNAYRLIFTFHWLSGNMHAAAQNAGGYYGLEAKAEGSAIFVSPNGIDAGWANAGGEDIAFVDEILKVMDEGFCINQNLRFATGFSYGGAMSHSVACSRADKFRAVSVIAGALLSGCDGGKTPIAYQHIHGISDSVLNISMGRSLRDQWVKVNGCTPMNPEEPSQGSGTHITTEYQGCSEGHPVVWIAHDGGHVAEPADRGQGNFAPEATWSFFSRFE